MTTIQTPGRFNFMEVPTEIRLQIYKLLLVCEGPLGFESDGLKLSLKGQQMAWAQSRSIQFTPPEIAILQTCKTVNFEAVPIFWGSNTFVVCLMLKPTIRSMPSRNIPFFLQKLRWSTITSIHCLRFVEETSTGEVDGNEDNQTDRAPTRSAGPAPSYVELTGRQIMASPWSKEHEHSICPSVYQSLSVRNWVSSQLFMKTLRVLQTEMASLSQLVGVTPPAI